MEKKPPNFNVNNYNLVCMIFFVLFLFDFFFLFCFCVNAYYFTHVSVLSHSHMQKNFHNMISHHITIFSCTSYVKKVVEMPKELLHCHMNELWVEILQQCRM